MALRTDKAYTRHLRADTISNLTGALKDGELGLVAGAKRVVINDAAVYNDFAMHKTVPDFKALQLSEQLTQPDNGGVNQAAAGAVTLGDEAEVIFNPTTAVKNHYKLAVDAKVGRRLTLKNSSAFLVLLGEVANMQTGVVVRIPSNKTVEILSDGTKWWVHSELEVDSGTFTMDASGFSNGPTNISCEWTRVGNMVQVSVLSGAAYAMNNPYTAPDVTVTTSGLPASLLPVVGQVYMGPNAHLIYKGVEHIDLCVEVFDNGSIALFRPDEVAFAPSVLLSFQNASFMWNINSIT